VQSLVLGISRTHCTVHVVRHDAFSSTDSTQYYIAFRHNAGGIAGVAGWIVSMPADTVKSVIQTSTAEPPKMLTVASRIIVQHGATALFKGLGVAVIRAFPANAGNNNSHTII
jgi:predicted dinucleotide-utilizing enzyme